MLLSQIANPNLQEKFKNLMEDLFFIMITRKIVDQILFQKFLNQEDIMKKFNKKLLTTSMSMVKNHLDYQEHLLLLKKKLKEQTINHNELTHKLKINNYQLEILFII